MSQQLSRDQRTQAPSSSIETPTTFLPVQPTQQSQARCTKNSNELLTGGMSNAEDITFCLKESGDYNISNSVANHFKLSVRGRTDLYHFEFGLYGERGWNFCPLPPCAPFLKALDDFVTYYKFSPLPNISEEVLLRKSCICSTPPSSQPVQSTQQSQARCTKNSNELLTGGMSKAEDINLCLTKYGDYCIGNSIANQLKLSVRGRNGVYHFELALFDEKGWIFHPPPPHRAPFLKELKDFVMYYKLNPLPNISEKVHLRKLRIYSTPTLSQPVQSTQQSQAHDATPFVPGESPNDLNAPPPDHDIVPPSMMTNNAAVVAAVQGKSDSSKDKMLMECTEEVNERGNRIEKPPSYVGLSDIEDDTLMLFDKLVACGSKRNGETAGLSKDNDSNSKRCKNVVDHAMPSSSSRFIAMSQQYPRDRETQTSSPSPTTSLPVQPTQLHDAAQFVPGESPNDLYHLSSNHDIVPPSIKYITVGCMPQEKPINPILMTLMETTKKLNELRLQRKKPTGRLSTAEEIATYLKEFGSYNIKQIRNDRVMLMVRGHSDVYYYELSLHDGKGWTFYPLPPNGLWPFHKTTIELVDFHRTTALPDIPEKLCLRDSVSPPASNTSENQPYFIGLFNSRDKNDLRAKWKELVEMRQ